MTTPPHRFGAHEGCGLSNSQFFQLTERFLKRGRLHMIGVAAERIIFPGGVDGVRNGLATAAQVAHPNVANSGLSESGVHDFLVEVWITVRAWKCADVDKRSDTIGLEQIQKDRPIQR